MKKICVTMIMAFVVLSGIAAQNLDYRQVLFGNNYENITEINADTFFEQYPHAKHVRQYGQGPVSWYDGTCYRVYKQEIGTTIFYRIMSSLEVLSDTDLLDWKNEDTWFDQQLLYKVNEKELQYVRTYTFNGSIATQHGTYPYYENVEIIERNDRVVGLLSYTIEFYERAEYKETRQRGEYVLFEDMCTVGKDISRGMKSSAPQNIIRIEASTPLIDKTRPFMYTIQNAFDGNPATSYVEDTKDDLMHITAGLHKYDDVAKLLLINGYAQNKTTYENNNRIKEISDKSISPYGTITEYSDKKIVIQDNMQDKQVFDWWDGGFFTVTDIYKGKRYTDTCLAELDFYISGLGWLFGGDL